MVNQTRSSCKIRDKCTEKVHSGGKGSSSSHFASDSYGLRRSTRESSSKKPMVLSSPTTRKLERLEKQTPPTSVSKDPEKSKRQRTVSPVRRSERCKKRRHSSSSLISKKSARRSVSSDRQDQMEKKEKNAKQLEVEDKESSKSNEEGPASTQMRTGNLSARDYRAHWRAHLRTSRNKDKASDCREELSSSNKFFKQESNDSGSVGPEEVDAVNDCSDCSQKIKDGVESMTQAVEKQNEENTCLRPKAHPSQQDADYDSGRVENSSSLEKQSESMKFSRDGRSLDGHVCLEEGQEDVPDKQSDSVCLISDASAMAAFETVTSAECNMVQIDGVYSNRRSGEPEATVNLEVGEKQNLHVLVNIDAESGQSTCFICKLGGELLCCDGAGCQRKYHHLCLDPQLNDVPPGVWYCLECVRKMMEYGAYSVSEGVECICDCREGEVLDPNGCQKQKQKQFLVKYKGLAHFHNQWLPQAEVAAQCPSLVASFLRTKQVVPWKLEWTLPRRLLQKQMITSCQFHSEHDRQEEDTNVSMCHYQWLVKWCGLDYEHASWELENASLFLSSEAQSLVKQYENRVKRATGARNGALKKLPERKICLRNEMSKLPAKVSLGPANNHADLVNFDSWKRSRNVTLVDDQERISKVTSFILSLESDGCLPFLIISPSTLVYSWDAEFFRLAPTVNVVVYNGSKDARRRIRKLEFFEDGASIVFEVLISPPEAIIEDMDILTQIEWEGMVVDECQQPRTFSFFEEFKKLKTQMRFLLFNGDPKENVAEYCNLLCMLDNQVDKESMAANSNERELKERLLSYTSFEGKIDSSRFMEYWIPTEVSDVQLEQYCATLLSNSLLLCSSSKGDPIGVLRDILVTARKCCSHPYLVDPSLQGSLMKDLQPTEYLDVGIKASGKLELLDRLLLELKKQHLKVLILFQSIGGSGKERIGDILDDFLRQRFGGDSYERVDAGILPSNKKAALNKFNDKELGRFVLLLENRACTASIKLLSVDMVIIFDSDWNPASDLRNLQKLTIESQVQIKVLRLYLSCTVEEKALIGATQGIQLESQLQNISPNASHKLLMWGASYLMQKLDKFHGSSSVPSMVLSDHMLANSVVQEALALLPQNENSVKSRSFIVKVQQTLGTYCTDFPLVGALKVQSPTEDLPHIFWTKLLEGKHPCWKYLSASTPRNRKRVQSNVNIKEEVDSDGIQLDKKRKKLTNNGISLSSRKRRTDGEKKVDVNKEGTTRPFFKSLGGEDLAAIPEGKMVDSDEGRKLRDAQRSLHLLLKPDISKLCDLLNLSDNIKGMVDIFLDYVIDNHHVTREPASILQAFQLALCWTAVSLSKEKIDRTESLELAKKHLNYQCKEEEADHVYLMLRHLKKMFLHLGKNLPVNSLKRGEVKHKELETEQSGIKSPLPAMPCLQRVKVEVEDCTFQGSSSNEVISSPKLMVEFGLTLGDSSESGREIQNQNQNQNQKQTLLGLERRKNEICREYETEKVLLKSTHQVEAALVRYVCGDSTRIDKLNKELSTKIEECSHEMAMRLKEIEAEYLASKKGVQQGPVKGDGCFMPVQLLNKLPEARHGQDGSTRHDRHDNADPSLMRSSDQSADATVHAEKGCLPVRISSNNDEMRVASGTVSAEFGSCANGIPMDNQGNAVSLNPSSWENLPIDAQGHFISSHAQENVTMNACILVDEIPDSSSKEAVVESGPVEAQESVDRSSSVDRLSSPDPKVSGTKLPDGCESGVVDNINHSDEPHINRSISRMLGGRDKVGATDHALENVNSLNACSSDDQILDGSSKEAIDGSGPVEAQESVDRSSSPDPKVSGTKLPDGCESGVVDNINHSDEPHINRSISRMLGGRDKVGATDHALENVNSLNACSSDDQILDGSSKEAIDGSGPVEAQESVDRSSSPDPKVSGTKLPDGCESGVVDNINHSVEPHINRSISRMLGGRDKVGATGHALENVSSLNACSSDDQILDGSSKEAIDGSGPVEAQESVDRSSSPDPKVSGTKLPDGSESGLVDNINHSDGPHKAVLVNRSISRMLGGRDKVGATGHALENVSSLNACSSDDQILDGSRKEALDELAAVEVQANTRMSGELEDMNSPETHISERELCNGFELEVLEDVHPSDGPHEIALVDQSKSIRVPPSSAFAEGASLSSHCTLPDQELGDDCNATFTSRQERNAPNKEQQNDEVALVDQSKSIRVPPSSAFAEGASVSSHCTLPDQKLGDDCNATFTSRQERNAPNKERQNDETIPDEELRDDCNATSIGIQEENASGKQQHDAEVASMTSHRSVPDQDLIDDSNTIPAITQEGNAPDEEQQSAEDASVPSYLTLPGQELRDDCYAASTSLEDRNATDVEQHNAETLPEEELRINCNATSTGMQERNSPDVEQHNAEGASLSSYHNLTDQELGDDFSAPSAGMHERVAPDEELHNASQHAEFRSSDSSNATSSSSGAADGEPSVLPQPQDQPINHSSHDLDLVRGTATPAHGVGETSNLTVHIQPTEIDENPAMPPNQAMSESAVSIPSGRMVAQISGDSTASVSVEIGSQLLQSSFPLVQPRTPLKLHSDPLQNELDRMQREMDQIDKAHEDRKMQLVSDCDKEIEEIRRKYDLKLKDIEAEYLPKKREFDMNHRKVLMNRMLAEAFKSKYSDIRASGANGSQRDVASGPMQPLVHLSSQQNAQQPLPVRGPSAGLQSNRIGTVATPFTSSQSCPPNVASLQRVGPPVVSIFDSSALSSGMGSRPPQISLTMPPPSANIQAPSDLRSPAPHLQALRTSVASSGTPSPGLPNQQPPSNPPPISAPLQQFSSAAAAPPAGPAGSSSWHHGGGSAGGLPTIEWGSDLLMDDHPLRPQITIPPSQKNNSPCSNATSDVVYLSDDD